MRHLFIALGFLFIGLGCIGVALPVFPTTPFLLLASFFLAKGSPRFNAWFMSTKLYENHLESFVQNRSMTLKTKISICTLATIMMGISLFVVPVIWVKILLAGLILFMYYYFTFRIETIKTKKETVCDQEEEKTVEQDISAFRKTAHKVREMHGHMFDEAIGSTPPSTHSASTPED